MQNKHIIHYYLATNLDILKNSLQKYGFKLVFIKKKPLQLFLILKKTLFSIINYYFSCLMLYYFYCSWYRNYLVQSVKI